MIEKIIVSEVRKKKELQFLGKSFILSKYAEMIRLDKQLREKVASYSQAQLVKSKEFKKIVKDIRASARKIYGIFQPPKELVLRDALKELSYDSEYVLCVLESHLSTKERLADYETFFTDLESEFGKPTSVLDLACGLNLVAYYYYTKNLDTKYLANELSEIECEQLQSFLNYNNIDAKAVAFDCVKETDSIPAQKFDWCFLLKALDTFEYQKKYITYDILKSINATVIIASFPIQNIRGMGMQRDPKINWFEKMLERGEYQFKTRELGGEVIYIVTQTS